MTTYPEMDREIVKLLRMSGTNYELYAAARIEQIESELNSMSVKYEQSIFERCNLVLQNKSLLDELTQIKTHRRDA